MPGGAQIFSERVREKMFADKIGADEWLGVIKTAHRLGIPSNAIDALTTIWKSRRAR